MYFMKIIYIANARIPTEKAHGFQIMKMCEEFSNLGNIVELIVPRRINKVKQDPFEFYDIKRNFGIKKLFSIDLLPFESVLGNISFYLQNLSFAKRATFYCLLNKADIIFSRDLLSALFLSILGKKVCFEVHDSVPVNWFSKKYLKKIYKIVSTNNYKKEELARNFGINPEKIFVAPNGVDLEKFDITESKEEIRKKLSFKETDKNVVLYAGKKYGWKGVDILTQAHQLIKESCFVELVTVTDKPHRVVPYWLKSADILILPNSRNADEMQAHATSPIKLFEYMASGVPIVASDIPAIREIVSEREVCFVEPDNPEKLAEGIKRVLDNPEDFRKRAEGAKDLVKQYTWQKRAKKISYFLN